MKKIFLTALALVASFFAVGLSFSHLQKVGADSNVSGMFFRTGSPVTWTCGLNALAATLTQCQPAPGAGLSLYITDIAVQTTTATSGTYAIQMGTGSNCVTATAALFPVSGTANRFNAPITTSAMGSIRFLTPLKVTANSAVCVIGVATNTISIQLSGFTAP